MSPGYDDDPYFEPSRRVRKKRIAQNPQRSQRMRRVSSRSDMGYPPPPPPPPPRSRPRPPDRLVEEPGYRERDYYSGGDEYYDRGYDYAPPPPRRARSPRPRRRAPARPAPAYYYQDDDYYDRPPPRRRPDYDDDYQKPPREQRVGSTPKKSPPPKQNDDGSGGKIAVAIVILVIILLLLYIFWPYIYDFANEVDENGLNLRYVEYPDSVDFTVRKDMTLQVQNDPISFTLKSACPKDYYMGPTDDRFYLQDVKDVDLAPVPNTGYPDISNTSQEIMLWEADNFQGTQDFEATYTITTRFFEWEFDEENSGSITEIPTWLKDKYNHDEWPVDEDRDGNFDPGQDDLDGDGEMDYLIEMSNPRIRRIARDLQDGSTNVYKVVKSIYDYLIRDDNLNYVPSSAGLPKDCISTLNARQGDCDDYSILLVSLLRSVDIPAWLELGVLYDRQSQRWGGHGWAKVAIPFDGGWSAVTIDVVNKQFLFHDPYRFIEWRDTGGDITVYEDGQPKQVCNLDYYYHSFSYTAYGRPRITSPDTNNFVTEHISESTEKHKVPVEGDPGSDLCFTPGFEALYMMFAMVCVIFVLGVAGANRMRRQ